jgi:Kef-type K+ transport system membrane component KefB
MSHFLERFDMTNTEFRLLVSATVAMMIAAAMLLAVMFGLVDPDTVRTPFQVSGLVAIIAFASLHITQWRRRSKP